MNKLFKQFFWLFFNLFESRKIYFLFVKLLNLYFWVKKINQKINYDSTSEIFSIVLNNSKDLNGNKFKHHFFVAKRTKLYLAGLLKRGKYIGETYSLDCIKFCSNDIVIDCGSNSGDLFLYFDSINEYPNILSFEPEPNEFKALSLNSKKYKEKFQTFNIALSNENGMSTFWSSTDNADSSLIKPKNNSLKIDVETKTLSSFIQQQNIFSINDSIKLLKLEAEGWEPEILEGLDENIKKIEYITVDVGWERGEDEQSTIREVSNYLFLNNFEILSSHKYGPRLLFKNKIFS